MSSTDADSGSPHVVVVGAGFAGVACAKALGKHGVAVTLIDKNTYHQFQPLLYQVATAQLSGPDIMRPLRGLFRKVGSVAVKNAAVTSIDATAKTVTTDDGQTFAGTHLVLALGTRPNFFGISGAPEYSFPLYSANDAIALRNRILQLFEDADLDASRIDKGALNFVIVGAGATGVETAGSLADMVRDVLPQRYHDMQVGRARIILVDHGNVVLGPFSESAHDYASKVLTKKGVELLLGHSVTEVCDDRVKFSDGTEIASHCVVWAGGMKAATFDGADALPTARGGRIVCGQDLEVEGFDGVYAAGDIASVEAPDGTPYPQLGSVALQAGDAVAASILADIAGTRTPSFKYHDKGIMAMIGRRAAVAEVGAHRHELHGPIAFSAWLGVHAWLLSTTRARIDAFMNWAWDSFSKSRSPAIIDDPDAPRIAWDDDDEANANDVNNNPEERNP
ncbi:MAG: NAD(P)/FAD-dependent oxidoreductase [Ilumatobacteraceae bacterium]